jgi:hypothetical protein
MEVRLDSPKTLHTSKEEIIKHSGYGIAVMKPGVHAIS